MRQFGVCVSELIVLFAMVVRTMSRISINFFFFAMGRSRQESLSFTVVQYD
jgi:hypothetical protein